MQKLNIITPVTRPANLPGMYHDIEKNCSPDMNIIWWLVFDASVKEQGNEWKEKFMNVSNRDLLINVIICENDAAVDIDHINHVLGKMEDALEFDQELGDEWVHIENDLMPICDLAFIEALVADKKEIGYYDSNAYLNLFKDFAVRGIFRLRLLNGDRLDENDNSIGRMHKILSERNNENQRTTDGS